MQTKSTLPQIHNDIMKSYVHNTNSFINASITHKVMLHAYWYGQYLSIEIIIFGHFP